MKTVQFEGTTHQFPDDFTDADIAKALSTAHPAQPQAPASLPDAPQPQVPGWAHAATGLLPAIGGGLGGMAGAGAGTVFGMGVGGIPGAVGGATLGAAGGEALRQMIERGLGGQVPETSGEAAKQIGIQGAIGAGSELAGAGLVGAAGMAGRVLSKRGVIEAAKNTKNLARLAGKGRLGLRFNPMDLVSQLHDVASEAGQLSTAAEKKVGAIAQDFLTNKGTAPLTPARVHVIKQQADAMAARVYRAEQKGENVPLITQLKAKVYASIGNRARGLLNDAIPGYQAANKETQNIIRARQAVMGPIARHITSHTAGAAAGAAVGAAIPGTHLPWQLRMALGAGAGGAMLSPSVLEMLGSGLLNPAVQGVARQVPRAGVGAVQALGQ